MQYNYVVTAHKPSNVNLSVTGRKPALIATPILPSCPSAVLAALPSLSRLFAPSSPSSLVLPPLPSTSEDALFSVHACPFRSAFDPFAAAEHPCTTHTHLPLHPFRSSFHHLLISSHPGAASLSPPRPPETYISTLHPCCHCMVSPAACTVRMAPLHRDRLSFDRDSALAAHPCIPLHLLHQSPPPPSQNRRAPSTSSIHTPEEGTDLFESQATSPGRTT